MNKLKLSYIAAVAAVSALISACGGGDDNIPSDVSFTVVDTEDKSGIQEQRLAVIKSGTDWTALWAEHKTYNQVSIPTIDFSKKMAVGVFLGMRPLGCYSVAIKTVVQSASKITVQYKETTPPPGTACTAELVFPSQIATIPASHLSVEFARVD